jgi:hypothetical protein
MKLITLEWLKTQSQSPDVDPQIQQDIIELLSNHVDGKPATEYLKPRTMLIGVSATTGKWNRKKHEQLCKTGVDSDFENWNAVGKKDQPTLEGKALPYDLMKDGTYMQIIPDKPENFFQNAEQAMQAVHDNPALQDEVLKQDHRLHLPFVDADGNKFVADVFEDDGALYVRVFEFSYARVWHAGRGGVFVFPQQPSES